MMELDNLVSRQKALSEGMTRYFTGKPCKHGHISERFAKSRVCLTCSNRLSKESIQRAMEQGKEWVTARYRAYYARNAEARRQASKEVRNKNKEQCKARMRRWQKENASVCRHHASLRKARLLQATPPWVDLDEIKEIYKSCPAGHHVDHILPLVHAQMCGLHVSWNLQYLPASENMSKGNRVNV